MTDYSKMSDLEINIMVSKSLYGELSNWHKGELNEGVVDYCNNPSDAWPIIVENHVAVVPYRHTTPQAWPTKFGIASKFLVEDRNPLRAAMIVYLMMKESENG